MSTNLSIELNTIEQVDRCMPSKAPTPGLNSPYPLEQDWTPLIDESPIVHDRDNITSEDDEDNDEEDEEDKGDDKDADGDDDEEDEEDKVDEEDLDVDDDDEDKEDKVDEEDVDVDDDEEDEEDKGDDKNVDIEDEDQLDNTAIVSNMNMTFPEDYILESLSRFKESSRAPTERDKYRVTRFIKQTLKEDRMDAIELPLGVVNNLKDTLPVIGKRKLTDIQADAIETAAPITRSHYRVAPIAQPFNPLIRSFVPPDLETARLISRLTSLIHAIGKAGNGETTLAFLKDLQVLANHVNPNFFIVSRLIFFPNDTTRKSRNYRSPAYKNLGSITRVTKPNETRQFTLACATFPMAGIVGQSVEDRVATEWHANLILVVNGKTGCGKDFIIGEPNVLDDDQRSTETDFKKIFEAPMAKLLKSSEVLKKNYRFWINTQRAEENNEGECLRLVLEWMLELVIDGFPGDLNESGRLEQILTKTRGYKPTPYLYRALN